MLSAPGPAMAVRKPLIHVSYAYIMVLTCALPVAGLFGVVLIGYYLHFDGVTRTHCKVPNVVPSVSAVVGGYTPERYIWRLAMAFFSFPRILDAFIYYNFFSHCPLAARKAWYRWLNRLNWFLHVWQYMSLFQLTYVSSTENFIVHRNGFIGFVACSVLHMVTFLVLFRTGRQPPSQTDKLSLKLRVAFASLHIVIFFISLYFYWRHNTFCEPYMYSWYSLSEYLVILSNIAFHTVMILDLGHKYYLTIVPHELIQHQD